MRLLRHKRVLVAVTVAGLMLAGAGSAWAYFTTNGTGTGSVPVGNSSALTVSVGAATGGAMLPAAIGDSNAVVDTVPFTVLNTAEGDQSFSTLTLEVTPGYTHTDGAGDPPCTASDFSIDGSDVGTAVTVSGLETLLPNSDGTHVTPAPAANGDTYYGSLTIQLVENGANQDSCEGQTIPLTVAASSTSNGGTPGQVQEALIDPVTGAPQSVSCPSAAASAPR